ncbi:hypothetical protein NC653_000066 [Populus alba x Populus x berolinensis]|uniref:Thiolase C-terminal domain-containing protein n=1 Tax=Populus alba x Populus x berolinensis TaxID=444605 RepID=A0AAD6RI96_9ROSI|nr:hypothetical protein NC653_000066 [Populus alba x Populus x berolinensis]
MEKAINRQRVLLDHLRPSSSSHNFESTLSASACLAGDSAAYQRTSAYGDDVSISNSAMQIKAWCFKDTHADDLLAPVLKYWLQDLKEQVNAGWLHSMLVSLAVADVACFYQKQGSMGFGAGLESMTINQIVMGWRCVSKVYCNDDSHSEGCCCYCFRLIQGCNHPCRYKGNSSQLSDGAGAGLILKKKCGCAPMVLPILGVFRTFNNPLKGDIWFCWCGSCHQWRGGPAVAIPAAVKAAGLDRGGEFDLFEINEAFDFPVCIMAARSWKIDPQKINVNGGQWPLDILWCGTQY